VREERQGETKRDWMRQRVREERLGERPGETRRDCMRQR